MLPEAYFIFTENAFIHIKIKLYVEQVFNKLLILTLISGIIAFFNKWADKGFILIMSL